MLKLDKHEPRMTRKGKILRAIMTIELIALISVAYVIPQFFITEKIANIYCRHVFPVWAFFFNNVSNMFLISITENLIVVGVLMIIVMLILSIVLLAKKRKNTIFRTICIALITVLFLNIQFQLMHGINYSRTSVARQLDLMGTREVRPYEQYSEALQWAYRGMIEARRELGEDYNGVAHMSTNYETTVQDANAVIDAISDYYGLDMSRNYIRAKAVSLSHLWRFTDIVGAYDMFLGESNINTDYLDVLYYPSTLCHEIIHAKGYARETDANIAAVIACISSPRADFRYSGYFEIFMHLLPTVIEYAEYEGATLFPFASDPNFDMVRRDIAAYDEYETRFELGTAADVVSEISENTNNAFLEANGQEGGTKTYVIPVDYYVEFYWNYVADTDDA